MTFVELLVAISIISIGMLAFTGSFRFITHSIRDARARSLALSLAQEKVENLKNTPYHKLQISTQVVTYSQVTPPQICDAVNYPPETIQVGGIAFTRCVYVSLTRVNNHVVDELSALYPDSGLKWVEVVVLWQQRGEWKKFNLNNLHENPNVQPLNATLKGRVRDAAGNAIPNAVVTVLDKADWQNGTDSAGSYLIQVNEGSYFLKASSAGYHDLIYSSVTLAEAQILTTNFALTPIATGTVSGNVYFSSHLVISQIVWATTTRVGGGATQAVEYFTLFNPTTYPIDIGTLPAVPKISVDYTDEDGVADSKTNAQFNWTYHSTFVPTNKSFLYASATHFYVAGKWVDADASYGLLHQNYLPEDKAGALRVTRVSDSAVLDTVGWNDFDSTAPLYEGSPMANPTCGTLDGPQAGNMAIRYSSPAVIGDGFDAWAYDSGSNSIDFAGPHSICGYYPMPVLTVYPFSTRDSTQTVIGGVPAVGALVTANDLIGGSTNAWRDTVTSAMAQVQPYARFRLQGVSTGTWTVLIATGQYFAEISSVVVPSLGAVAIPNAATGPAWSRTGLHVVRTTQPAVGGYVHGLVRNSGGAALAGISVLAGGYPVTTGSNGRYFAATATGPISVVINANYANTSYQEYTALVTVGAGSLQTVSADLSQRGVVMGYITSDGNSVLPNIQVTASRNGQQFGAATSDSSGNFYFNNLSTGDYQVEPTLDPLEIWSPSSAPAHVVAGQSIHIGTFVVTGAQGKVGGNITLNGARVTTGALILITTGTLSSTPPAIIASSAPAQSVIYSGSSKADGTYEIEVRGSTSTTYRVSAYVPVISGTSVSVSTKTYTGVVVYSTGTTTRHITIP